MTGRIGVRRAERLGGRGGNRDRSVAGGLALGLAVLVAGAAVPAAPVGAQLLELSPNVRGTWTADPGVVHFHVLHRFQVTDPPARKVLNTPTFLLGAGLTETLMVGARYASNSVLVAGRPNEWEAFGRWAPLDPRSSPVGGSLRAGWNATAESVDGEVSVARWWGPVGLQLAGRGFSSWAGGDAATALAGGAVWRLHRWVALAGDVARLLESGAEVAWSAGVQLAIPYTPHTLSLHASNVNATTLQSASVGVPDQRLWGFEFTIPLTLSRYFGGRDGAEPAAAAAEPGPGADAPGAPADTAVVGMDNRLRFLPDTVRIGVGDAVRWENSSDLVHTVTADPSRAADPAAVALPEDAAPFDSGDLAPGQVYVRSFPVVGTYRYVCLPHEAAGMVGVVVVSP